MVFSGRLLYHRASLLESGDGHQNFQGTVLWTGGVNVNFNQYYLTRQFEKAGPLYLRATCIEI